MKRIEQFFGLTALVGLLLKIFLIPGGNLVLGISLTTLAVIYYPLGFFFFNFTKPKEVFNSASYKKITFSRGLGTIPFQPDN